MSDYRVLVRVEDGTLTVRTDLRAMPIDLREATIDALSRHLACRGHHAPMRKAGGSEQPDPRYAELAMLIEHARGDWEAWGAVLTQRVLDLLDAGKLLPLTEANEHLIRALFEDHQTALLVALQGDHGLDARRMGELQAAGLVSPQIAARGGYLSLAYRLGRGLDALKAHERPLATRPATMAEVLRTALATHLTPEDTAAVAWARQRAGFLITRPVVTARGRVLVRLTDQEAGGIRAAVAAHLQGEGGGNLKHDLAAALRGTDLQNDLDRIARTEMLFAHGYGAYQALKAKAAELGDDDPLVYRLASVNACTHCKRIWGPPTVPVVYRLSLIEAREAAGGNVGLPAAQWGPVIGPVHPNCACSPMALYRPEFKDAIGRVADDILKTFGRF
jgi:hypothetical protein